MMGKCQLVPASTLTLAVLCALLLVASRPAQAQTETVLYSFTDTSGDAAYPQAGLVMDTNGNLYGTTSVGGAYNEGTVFEVTVAGAEEVLYSFGSQAGDGNNPGAGLIFDKTGNLYGTTFRGGANGWGTVFKLTPAGTETVLYSFTGTNGDGANPQAGLVMDKKGNLYGTTMNGGANIGGAVFELTTKGTEKVLYSFGSQAGDGTNPVAGLTFDTTGNLYGTTFAGGAYNEGTVFELTKAGTEKVLYSFGSQAGDGANPTAGLTFYKKGNLYGTTIRGGSNGEGTVFELTAAGTEMVLHSFSFESGDGASSNAGLIFDKKGNLYGTTTVGGANSEGTVFELTAKGTEKILYSFGSQMGDGANPVAGLIFDKMGDLYGTTVGGGLFFACPVNGCGTVFKLTP